jgi:hypothetical protein
VAEYLAAGVSRICVLGSSRALAMVYSPDKPEATLTSEMQLSFPEILPGFAVSVEQLFA